jgi:HK97 family phage prohead protease
MEIQINKPVIREVIIRGLSEENIQNREAEFVISDETVDSFGTVFLLSGWDLKRYERNPVVLYAHRSNDANPDFVIGTSTVRIEDGKLIALAKFESGDDNPLADKVWRKIKNGTLKMASIGANPKSGYRGDAKRGEDPDVIYFDNQELLEWSVVPIGSNPEAMKREIQILDEIKETIIPIVEAIQEVEIKKEKTRSLRECQLIINTNLYK